MRQVPFKEPEDCPQNNWYKTWKKRAAEETKKAIKAYEAGEDYEFDAAIWSKVKAHLFELFNGKCAYCEAKVLHVASGDVEHFRPKSKVKEDKIHPGYYWLAYDLHNLFPSCEKCNRAGGKMNQFPIETHIRVYKPDEKLDKEKPLLLNPYVDKPEEHLKFTPPKEDVVLGTVAEVSERGRESIRAYNLNREPLIDERRVAQMNMIRELDLALVRRSLKSVWEDLKGGGREYSAALLVAAQSWWNQIKEQVEG